MPRTYGWQPQLPDQRDLQFTARSFAALPPMIDLRPECPPVYDQGQLGSCTANAGAALIQFNRMKQNYANFEPSRLFIYWNERAAQGTQGYDSGATLRGCMKEIVKFGAPPEIYWAYDEAKVLVRPPQRAYQVGRADVAQKYLTVPQVLDQMRACVAAGFPFMIGFTVYDSFESDAVASTGVVPMPAETEAVLGGHAVCVVGYDDSAQRFIVRNSWGPDWGMAGYCTMPYAYVSDPNLASDFWTIRQMS